MFQRLWQHKWAVAALAGVSVFLAFPRFNLVPTILFYPFLAIQSVQLCQRRRDAFLVGFLTSFVVMLGGFYWVTYVLHEFGYLPWVVAGLLYLCFCGFGALNFPIFTLAVHLLDRRLHIFKQSPRTVDAWYCVGFPVLFTGIEYLVPKLFPWFLGHCLYRNLSVIQIAEFSGSLIFTLMVCSLGGGLFRLSEQYWKTRRLWLSPWAAFPLTLWVGAVGYSHYALRHPFNGHPVRFALVQANIGSLEKVAARKGFENKMRHTLDSYLRISESAVRAKPAPDFILWPETAMPFQLEYEQGRYTAEVRQNVLRWGIPLITGGYGTSALNFNSDYNTAFLLEPMPDGTIRMERYHKNILLAFGEYMPFGDWFPILYRKFPQVSNFERGQTQEPFVTRDGIRLGVTICYEAIVPSFFRKVAQHDVNAVINLTNDSWFGPTAEPYLHGAISVFRAVETRLPLIRVTNTGTSFTVDQFGRRSRQTRVYAEDLLVSDLIYSPPGTLTLYTRYGDWILIPMLLGLILLIAVTARRKHASVSR